MRLPATGTGIGKENAHSTTHDETNPQTRCIRMGTADKQGEEEEEGMKQLTAGTTVLSPAAQEVPRSLNHGRRLLRHLSSRGGIARARERAHAQALSFSGAAASFRLVGEKRYKDGAGGERREGGGGESWKK
jgi:hypothetical protein